jgi:hypothetical protein
VNFHRELQFQRNAGLVSKTSKAKKTGESSVHAEKGGEKMQNMIRADT